MVLAFEQEKAKERNKESGGSKNRKRIGKSPKS